MAGKIKFAIYYDRDSWNKDEGTLNNLPSLTDESFEGLTNINDIILSMGGTPRTPVGQPNYDMGNYDTADWTFEDWQNQKALIERKFLHLNDEAKAFFKTPQEFFKYCSNPDKYELMEGVGIVEKEILNSPTVIPETVGEPETKVEP